MLSILNIFYDVIVLDTKQQQATNITYPFQMKLSIHVQRSTMATWVLQTDHVKPSSIEKHFDGFAQDCSNSFANALTYSILVLSHQFNFTLMYNKVSQNLSAGVALGHNSI